MTVRNKVIVGAFVLGGFLLFALGLFWIGDRRLLFSESIQLTAEFANLSGLKVGSKVLVAGMDAGEVLSIEVPQSPGEKFDVRFRVLDTFRPLMRKNSVASIQVEGLVGSKVLQVEPGTQDSPRVDSGAIIASREPVEIAEIIQQSVDTITKVNAAIDEVQQRTVRALDVITDVGEETRKLTVDVGQDARELFATGNEVITDVNAVVADIRKGKGTIGKLFTEDTLYQQTKNVVSTLQTTAQTAQRTTEDVQHIVGDLRSRNLGEKVANTAANMQKVTADVSELVASFRKPPVNGERGLTDEVRYTLENTREATADLAENMEALKRNWFFRGFFRSRGFYDLDAVSVADYRKGEFAPKRGRERTWLQYSDLFEVGPGGAERLTPEGKKRLDEVAAPYLKLAASTPMFIEGYAGEGAEDEQFLVSRQRARAVRNYLVDRFGLKTNYVGTMPMGAVRSSGPNGEFFDGVAVVYFPEKEK